MPFKWLLLFSIVLLLLAKVCANSHLVFNGKILPSLPSPALTSSYFEVTVNCANCERDHYKQPVNHSGTFQIELCAKEGKQIDQIEVHAESLTSLGTQKRSFDWLIDAPSSDNLYKLFIGYFSPHCSERLSLHGRFDGELPLLSDDPNTFYSVRLKRLDQPNSNETTDADVLAEIFAYGQKEDIIRREWKEKGFALMLNHEGIKYLRANRKPSMELQLVTVEVDLTANWIKSPSSNKGTSSPYTYYLNAENEKKTEAIETSPCNYYPSETVTRERGSDFHGTTTSDAHHQQQQKKKFGEAWASPNKKVQPNVKTHRPSRFSGIVAQHQQSDILQPPRGNAVVDHPTVYSPPPAAEAAHPIYGGHKTRQTLARNADAKVNKMRFGEESDDDDVHHHHHKSKMPMCCFFPKLSFNTKRFGSERGSSFASSSQSAKSAAAAAAAAAPVGAVGAADDDEECASSEDNCEWPSTQSQSCGSTSNAGQSLHLEYNDGGARHEEHTTSLARGPPRDSLPNRKEASAMMVRSLSAQSDATSSSTVMNRRRDKRSGHYVAPRWSLSGGVDQSASLFRQQSSSRSSFSATSTAAPTFTVKEVLLSVRIEMPVLMKSIKRQQKQEDYFMYTFKLFPAHNKIGADEVNRQQVRAVKMESSSSSSRQKPMPTGKAEISKKRRNNSSSTGIAPSLSLSRTASSSSVLSDDMAKAYAKRVANASHIKQMKQREQAQAVQAQQQQQNAQLDASHKNKQIVVMAQQPAAEREKVKKKKEPTRSGQEGDEEPGQQSNSNSTKKERKPNGGRMSSQRAVPDDGEEQQRTSAKTKPRTPSGQVIGKRAEQKESEKMDNIWEQIMTTAGSHQQQGTEVLKGKEGGGKSKGDEEETLRKSPSKKESAMLREIRQKKKQLNKVPSPKRAPLAGGGEAEGMIGKPIKSEGSADHLEEERKGRKKDDRSKSPTLKRADQQKSGGRQKEKKAMQEEQGHKNDNIDHSHYSADQQQTVERMASYGESSKENRKTNQQQQNDQEENDAAQFERYEAMALEFMDKESVEELKKMHSKEDFVAFIKSMDTDDKHLKLHLDLTEAEIGYVKQYLERRDIVAELNPDAKTNIINIALILSDWLDNKPTAYEGLSLKQIAKLDAILSQLYPEIDGPSDVVGVQQIPGGPGDDESLDPMGHSIWEDEDEFGENKSPIEVIPHENVFKMVEEDLEAMKSDAESRAHLGNELKKLYNHQKSDDGDEMEQKSQSSGVEEEIERLFQGISEEKLNLLKAELAKLEGGTAGETKRGASPKANDLEENAQQENVDKFVGKPPKGKAKLAFESEIDIRTDSELVKRRQPKTALRILKAGDNKSKNADANNVGMGQQRNANEDASKSVPVLNGKKVEKQKEMVDQQKQQHQKAGDHGQTRASYSDWKKKNSFEGGITAAAATTTMEEEDPEGFYTPKPSPSTSHLKEQQQSAGFFGRQMERLSSPVDWFRGIVAKSDAEQGPEHNSYLKQLAELISTELNTRDAHPHGLKEDTTDGQ